MGKPPAFQFYVRDWLSDPSLKQVEFSTKGIWIDFLCYLWESETKGELQSGKKEFCRMIGCSIDEFEQFLSDANKTSFCDISVTDNGIITVRNRRMHRDEKQRKNNRERQQRFREKPKNNKKVTLYSSSSSSDIINNIFIYWQEVHKHKRAKLDTNRQKKIAARLKDGYTEEEIKDAIDGCKLSPHHMGKNDSGTVYDDIELICRDAKHIDLFRKCKEKAIVEKW